jgi:hypothetical protein
MDIAERTLQIKEDFDKVYEAGKKAEYDDFWDAFQKYGNRTDYNAAFAYAFPSKKYNPKYPLKGVLNTAFAQSPIRDVKVPILEATSIQNILRWNSQTTTIPELNISETTNVSNDPFYKATALKNIKLTGVLAKTLSFAYSPLSVDSIKSIVSCLKDYSGLTDDGGNTLEHKYTVTFKSSAFSALESEGATAEYNGVACTWAELVDNKKWNLVKG